MGGSSHPSVGLAQANSKRSSGLRLALARGISSLVNPPAVAAGLFLALVYGRSDLAGPSHLLAGICLFWGVALPTGYVWMLTARGRVEGLFIPQHRDRRGPLSFGSASFLLGSVTLWSVSAPPALLVLMICYAVNGLALVGLSFRWKISLHAVGTWGPLAALFYLFGPQALVLSPVPVAVCWARVETGAHTLRQVFAGGALSLGLTLGIFTLILGAPPSVQGFFCRG